MKEIKFRAWDKEKKVMIPAIHIFINWMWVVWENMRDGLEWNDDLRSTKRYELMQYTWLKDKNGKEIYEGDIVEYSIEWGYWQQDYTINRIVEYKEWHYNPFVHWHEEFTQKTYPECCEIIGSIYENPELVTNI